jgi:hypothetical protein
MTISEIKHVRKARKNHFCDWCAETIKKGYPYSTWFTFGESTTTRMHPECYKACYLADLYDEELPTAGTFRRGCHCGENKETCNCIEVMK